MPPNVHQLHQQTLPAKFNKVNISDDQTQNSNDSATVLMNMTSEHIYSSGNGGIETDIHNTSMPVIQYGKGKGPLPPPPLPQSRKPGWLGQNGIQQQDGKMKAQIPNSLSPNPNVRIKNDEEAIPNDSLYGGGHHQGQQMENHPTQKNGNAKYISSSITPYNFSFTEI
jgi:hypothetical protein